MSERLMELEFHIEEVYSYQTETSTEFNSELLSYVVYLCTGQRLSIEELDIFSEAPDASTFKDFLDWVIDRVKEGIEWLVEWWNS
jgi:hypothetical protein